MATIANISFNNNGSSVSFYNQELLDLVEMEHGLNINGITRTSFLSKVIPLFVYCGASIVTVFSESGKNVYAYEIQVDNPDDFSKSFISLVGQFFSGRP